MHVRNAALGFRQLTFSQLPAGLRRASAFLRRRRWDDAPARALTVLSPPQKALLRQFLEQDTTTIWAPTLSGVALGLELAGIIAIYREPAPVPRGGPFVLGLNGWVQEHLRRHPEILG